MKRLTVAAALLAVAVSCAESPTTPSLPIAVAGKSAARSISSQSISSGSSGEFLTLAKPAGTQLGDVLVLQLMSEVFNIQRGQVCAPEGWTRVIENFNGDNLSAVGSHQVAMYRVVTQDEPDSYRFFSATGGCTTSSVGGDEHAFGPSPITAAITRYSGVEPSAPIRAATGAINLFNSGPVAPSVDGVKSGDVVIALFGSRGSISMGAPAGMTTNYLITNNPTILSGEAYATANGASGASTLTSASAEIMQTVVLARKKLETSLVLTADRTSPQPAGVPVVFTAAVTVLSESFVVNSGSVDFYRGGTCANPGTPLGSAPVSNGSASIAASLAVGSDNVVACFPEVPGEFYAADPGSIPFEITRSASTTSLTAGGFSAFPVGTRITLGATVTTNGSPATGSISLYSSGTGCDAPGTLIAAVELVAVSATYDYVFAEAGTVTILACYSGSATVAPSGASKTFDVVAPTTTTTTLAANPAGRAPIGAPVALTATVQPSDIGPTTVVEFRTGDSCAAGSVLGTAPLINHQALAVVGGLSFGHQTIIACFIGTAIYAPSSATLPYEVFQPNRFPVITGAIGPFNGTEGAATTMSASAADADADPLVYTWSFGDGTTAVGPSVTHIYGDNGDYTVSLAVTDGSGGSASASTSAAISNVAPSATFAAPVSVDEGGAIALSLSSAHDVAADLPLTYAFSCDGVTWSSFGSSTSASCATTHYGSRVVKGRVRDKDGGQSEYAANVQILDVAPTVSAIASDDILIGETFRAAGTFTDPGQFGSWTAQVDYGDGSGSQALALSSGGFALTHRYTRAGAFTVRVTVTDDGGAVGSSSGTVTVLTPAAAVRVLGAFVDRIAESGVLRDGDVKPLESALRAVEMQLGKGSLNAASGTLGAFINKVEALVRSGRLGVSAGLNLIDDATRIQASLGR